MARVTGIGGVFMKSSDPERTLAWYRGALGIALTPGAGSIFRFADDPSAEACAVWSVFPADTAYFAPSPRDVMINFRVDDMDGMLARLAAARVPLAQPSEDHPYGRFAWVIDPDGVKIELWEQRIPPVGETK